MPLSRSFRLLPWLILLGGVLAFPNAIRADDDDDEREQKSSRPNRETKQDEIRKHAQEKERERNKKREKESESEEEDGQEGGDRGRGSTGTGSARIATNSVYADTCGACHVPYAPQLLPARSWERILGHLDKHFGEAPEATAKEISAISAYLKANAADHVSARPGPAIMKSIGSGTPERITDIPYIRGKHREIGDAVFARKAVGSRSNCSACHPGAASGEFHEDRVRIPR